MIQTLLGGITPQHFLREYWQKKPLLVRNAIPGFSGLLSPAEVRQLACDEDAESRLIFQRDKQWDLLRGPMQPRDFPRKGPWTTLVQGLNLLRDDADALLQQFSFIPYARLDDLMVSYATDGGGVGPHFDSYDVFLLQGMGQRRWQVSAQRDLTLVEDAPLKILKHFKPTQEWVLDPGDMLYLPPRYAHDGVAIGECMTYSIGFRAPSAQELGTEFLGWLSENLQLSGMYADPGLALARQPGRIPDAMIDQVTDMLGKISWSRKDVARFLGEYLSEPKPHVFFDPPEEPLSEKRFLAQARRHGLRLDRRTQILYAAGEIHVNGEPGISVNPAFKQLADRRELVPPADLDDESQSLLHEWYSCGFIHIRQPGT